MNDSQRPDHSVKWQTRPLRFQDKGWLLVQKFSDVRELDKDLEKSRRGDAALAERLEEAVADACERKGWGRVHPDSDRRRRVGQMFGGSPCVNFTGNNRVVPPARPRLPFNPTRAHTQSPARAGSVPMTHTGTGSLSQRAVHLDCAGEDSRSAHASSWMSSTPDGNPPTGICFLAGSKSRLKIIITC
jgi:hypothetical protein